MMTSPSFVEAAASRAPGLSNARTSFKIAAPASAASSMISGLEVSTDTQKPSFASAFTTGITRERSSSSGTSVAPGRVDSPPTSMIRAPSPRIFSAQASASGRALCSPPSEKESGVTLRMPMMTGSSLRSKSKGPQRQSS